MSAMAEMVADLLLKSFPPEVRALMTPENLEALRLKVITKWGHVEGALVAIHTAQNATLETVHGNATMLADIQETLARIEANVGTAGKRERRTTPKLVGGTAVAKRTGSRN